MVLTLTEEVAGRNGSRGNEVSGVRGRDGGSVCGGGKQLKKYEGR